MIEFIKDPKKVSAFVASITLVIGFVGWQEVSNLRNNAVRVGEPNEPVVVKAVEAVDRFYSQLKQQRYEDICRAAEPGAFLSETSLSCPEFLGWVHQKLGKPLSARRTQLPILGRQHNTVRVGLDYETDYAHGPAHERFGWRIKGEAVILTNYNVEADVLSH